MPRQQCDTSRRGRFRTQPKETIRRRHLANKCHTVRQKIKSRDTRKKGGSSAENYWETYYKQYGNPLLFLGIIVKNYKKEQRVEEKIKMIRSAFKKTALKYHPDMCKKPQEKKKMEELMRVATSAEETLRNDLEKNIGDGTKPPGAWSAGGVVAGVLAGLAVLVVGKAVVKAVVGRFFTKTMLNRFFKTRRIIIGNEKQPKLSVSKITEYKYNIFLLTFKEKQDDSFTTIAKTLHSAALIKFMGAEHTAGSRIPFVAGTTNGIRYKFKVIDSNFKLIKPNIKFLDATVNFDRNTIVFDNIRDKIEGDVYKRLTERTRKRSASSRRRLSSPK